MEESGVRVRMEERPRAVDLVTLPYPGFPTDLQPNLALRGNKPLRRKTGAFLRVTQPEVRRRQLVLGLRQLQRGRLVRLAQLLEPRGRVLQPQQALRGHDHERPGARIERLPPQQVEILRRRGHVTDLHVVLGAQLQEALRPGAGVLRPLAFVPVGQQQHHRGVLPPLRRVGSDELVGICVERSLEMLVGILGILKAGGAYVPLDLEQPMRRLAHVLEDTAAAVILTQRRLTEFLPQVAAKVLCLDAEETFGSYRSDDPPPVAAGENEISAHVSVVFAIE